ncbi:SdrD B-like domain-containing protein, partial [Arsenicibacter rosenii]
MTSGYAVGATTVVSTTGTVTSATAALGTGDGSTAILGANSALKLDMGVMLPAGSRLTVSYVATDAKAPLQVLVSSTAAGPFTNIAQLAGATNAVTLPMAVRYVQLITTGTSYFINAVTYPVYTCVTNPVPTCAAGQTLMTYPAGTQGVNAITGTVSNSANAAGPPDRVAATVAANGSITLDFGRVVAGGNVLSLVYSSQYNETYAPPLQMLVSTTGAPGSFTSIGSFQPTTNTSLINGSLTLPIDARYVQLLTPPGTYSSYYIDALTYAVYSCVSPPDITCGAGQISVTSLSGAQATGTTGGVVTSTTNVLGISDGKLATLGTNSSVSVDMGSVLAAGITLTFSYSSTDNTSPLQIWVANNAGDPYTYIGSVPASIATTTRQLTLPLAAQYIKLVATGTGYAVDAVTRQVFSCITDPAACAAGQQSVVYPGGGATSVYSTSGTLTNQASATGLVDGSYATLSPDATITLDLGSTIAAGNVLVMRAYSQYSATYAQSMQVLAATNAAGPYTSLGDIQPNTSVNTISFPLQTNVRFIRFTTTSNIYSTYYVDAVMYQAYACATPVSTSCSAGEQSFSYEAGVQGAGSTTGAVTSATNIVGVPDGTAVSIGVNSAITVDMGSALPAGMVLKLYYSSANTTAPMQVFAAASTGGPFTFIGYVTGSTGSTSQTLTLPLTAQYIQLKTAGTAYSPDAVTYPVYTCAVPPVTTCPAGQKLVGYSQGATAINGATGTVSATANALGSPDGNTAGLNANASITLDMGSTIAAGNSLMVTYLSANTAAPMQVLVSGNAGGPFTNIARLPGSASRTTQSVQLPVTARYVQLLTSASSYSVDAVAYPVYACVSSPSASCANGELLFTDATGAQGVGATTGTVTSATYAIGKPDGSPAALGANSSLILNMGSVVTAGNTLNITYQSGNTTAPVQVLVSTNAGGPYTNIAQLDGTTTSSTKSLILPLDAQYVQLQTTATSYWVDAVTRTVYNCISRPVVSCPAGQVSASYQTGLPAGSGNTVNMAGVPDGNTEYIAANSTRNADAGSDLPAGTTLFFTYSSADNTAPMQVLVSTNAGGPYTNIAQLTARTSMGTMPVTLPVSARYIRLQTTATAYSLDAVTYPVYTCVTPVSGTCSAGQQLVSYQSGAQSVSTTNGSIQNSTNLLGRPDGFNVSIPGSASLVMDMGKVITGGNSLQISYTPTDGNSPLQVLVATSSGGPYTSIAQLPNNYYITQVTRTVEINLLIDARYVKLQTTSTAYNVDAVTYTVYNCVNTPMSGCLVGQQAISSNVGAVSIVSSGNVTNPGSATGMPDGSVAATPGNTSATLILDLGTVVAGGNNLNIRYSTNGITAQMQVLVATNITGPYTNIGQLPASAGTTASLTLPVDVRYVQLQSANSVYNIDAVMYSVYTCISSSLTSGVVYLDANVDGVRNSTEPGIGGVTVRAYDAGGNLAGTTITADANPALGIAGGDYGFTNLTAGQPYRLAFSNWPAQYSSSGYGADNGTDVQFIQGVTTHNDFGLYIPGSVCSLSPNSKMVFGSALFSVGDKMTVGSWDYLDRTTGQAPLVSTQDISYLTVGVPIGIASPRPTNWVYMSAMSTDFTSVFPPAPDGSSAIYIANYNAPDGSQSYQGTRLLVKLSDLGIDVGPATKTVGAGTFGVQGLGGLDFTPSGDTMFVVNMYHGSLVGVNVSKVDYATLPVSKPTAAFEIYPPASLAGCSGGVYRPTALKQYGGKLYVGGVCDAEISTKVADLQGVVLAYEPATGTWSKTFSFPINFTGGGTYGETGHGAVDWSSSSSTEMAPVLLDLAFADNGLMVMGITDRFVYTYSSGNQVGYVIGAWKNTDGSYTLENAGKLGPYTSTADNKVNDGTGNYVNTGGGPGGKFFFQQKNFDGRPYGFSGGLYIKSGTSYVLAGYLDAMNGYSNGVVYLDLSTGVPAYGATLTGAGPKIARISGLDQVCDALPPIEIGNRVWKDTNNNGIQDAGEPPLAGVTVELRDAGGNLIVTAITDAGGNYSFSNLPNRSNTSAQKYNLPLTPLTSYALRISSLGSDTSTSGLTLTGISPAPGETAGGINTGSSTINNDAFLVGGLPVISLRTGVDGSTAHTYDFGFVDVPCSLSLIATPGNCDPATNQYTLTGTLSLTGNSTGGTATITDGSRSATITVAANATSVAYSLTGLPSDGVSHTVAVTLAGCSGAATSYTAPASCTVAASIVVASATVCYGSSATLTASGCTGTVTWLDNTTGTSLTTPNLTATTNYTATCTTSTGSATTAVGTVTVMPQPVLSLQASLTNVTVGTPVSLSALGCVGTVSWSTGGNGAVISVTPSQPSQTYSATCVTGPGCQTTASVTVNTQPAASLIVLSATVCYGSSATLIASGCTGTVTWSTSTTGTSLITPNLTQTTNYTATCTTSTGSATTAVGTVTVMPQPVLSLQASSTNVTVGTPVSLSAIGCVGTVSWSTGGNGVVISVTPSQPTQTYSATCVTGPGCQTTASLTVNTQPAASLVVLSATVCYGSSATLIASGCTGTVTWSTSTTGNTLLTPALTQTTAYTATCTTSTG